MASQRNYKIMVIAARSGGHIFPALGFISYFLNNHKDIELIFVLPKPIRKELFSIIKEEFKELKPKIKFFTFYPLSIEIKRLFLNIFFVSLIIRSAFFIIRFKPDLVLGFGSLFSVPFIFWASLLKAKTMIHEQNVVLGKANSFLVRFVDRIALSFSETEKYLNKQYREKIILTGNFIRNRFKRIEKDKALSFFGLPTDRLTLLVMGGSQASSFINRMVITALKDCSFKDRIQLIHLCGDKEKNRLEKIYKELGIKAVTFAFLKEMEYAYSSADMAISRAGASSISELIYFKLPAILIPYPYAGRHQRENAKILEKNNCAIVIEENERSSQRLGQYLEKIFKEPEEIRKMVLGYRNLSYLASEKILEEEIQRLLK